jgi:predicted Zn-dependent protease
MIKKIFTFIFLWIIIPTTSFAQDSIPISPDLKEENLLKFQNHFFKALAQKSIYNYRVAIENLEKCNQLKPNEISVLFELSKNYLMMKQFFEAEQYALQAIKLDPNNYWILSHLSKTYIASNNIKKAIPIHLKIAKQNPKEREKLVYLYFQNNQLDKAKALLFTLEKENQLSRNLIRFKNQFVKVKAVKKKSETKGLEALIKSFETDKSFETLRKILTLSANSDNSILLTYSNLGIELFPAQAFVYLMNAKALNNNKKFKKALELLTNGIDFVIDNNSLEADFYDEMFKSYNGLGNTNKANESKSKAQVLRKKK